MSGSEKQMTFPFFDDIPEKSWTDRAYNRLRDRQRPVLQEHIERQGYALIPHNPQGWEVEQEKERMLDELQDDVADLKRVIFEAKQRLMMAMMEGRDDDWQYDVEEALKILDIKP